MLGFKILAGLAMIAAVTGSLSYISHALVSGGAAKAEAAYLADAARVQRESAEDVQSRAAAETEAIAGELRASRLAEAIHRTDAARYKARLEEVEAARGDAEVCTPGCRPAWE